MQRVFVFIFLLIFTSKVFASQEAYQTLTLGLTEVLEIEKIIVEDVQYNRDEPMPNMKIKETMPIDANNTMLRLSPVKVQLHTNTSSPVVISALFKELNCRGNTYSFSAENLSIIPKSQTISNPYDHIISDIFTPYVNVKPDSALGFYRGILVFSIGGI